MEAFDRDRDTWSVNISRFSSDSCDHPAKGDPSEDLASALHRSI